VFVGVIYFAGPKSRWSRRIDPSETIYHVATLWRWLTRSLLLAKFRDLDNARCGYALMDGEVCLEHYDPPVE
jgi:hypothetical protein